MPDPKTQLPDSLRPLATAAPDELTRDEGMLRSQMVLPDQRTMLYAIPAESRRSPADKGAASSAALATRRRLHLGLIALCALLAGVGLVLAWNPAPSAPRPPRLSPLTG